MGAALNGLSSPRLFERYEKLLGASGVAGGGSFIEAAKDGMTADDIVFPLEPGELLTPELEIELQRGHDVGLAGQVVAGSLVGKVEVDANSVQNILALRSGLLGGAFISETFEHARVLAARPTPRGDVVFMTVDVGQSRVVMIRASQALLFPAVAVSLFRHQAEFMNGTMLGVAGSGRVVVAVVDGGPEGEVDPAELGPFVQVPTGFVESDSRRFLVGTTAGSQVQVSPGWLHQLQRGDVPPLAGPTVVQFQSAATLGFSIVGGAAVFTPGAGPPALFDISGDFGRCNFSGRALGLGRACYLREYYLMNLEGVQRPGGLLELAGGNASRVLEYAEYVGRVAAATPALRRVIFGMVASREFGLPWAGYEAFARDFGILPSTARRHVRGAAALGVARPAGCPAFRTLRRPWLDAPDGTRAAREKYVSEIFGRGEFPRWVALMLKLDSEAEKLTEGTLYFKGEDRADAEAERQLFVQVTQVVCELALRGRAYTRPAVRQELLQLHLAPGRDEVLSPLLQAAKGLLERTSH
jgi:hypothetical protein